MTEIESGLKAKIREIEAEERDLQKQVKFLKDKNYDLTLQLSAIQDDMPSEPIEAVLWLIRNGFDKKELKQIARHIKIYLQE